MYNKLNELLTNKVSSVKHQNYHLYSITCEHKSPRYDIEPIAVASMVTINIRQITITHAQLF